MELNALGATIMTISVCSVLSLTGYCLVRVFTLPAPDIQDLKGPLEIDTGDTEDAD